MDVNSPLFDRIRIRAESVGPEERDEPRCQHPGCAARGTHRAPMGRNREGQYFQFCLPHVQEYNKSYNYFAGMSDDAVAAFQKDSITGHRPTWEIGVNSKSARPDPATANMSDPFQMFDQMGRRRTAPKPEPARPRIGKLALQALETLNLDETADPKAIRAQFKTLVKRLHPDANGGDRSREDKLREIINAYNTLKSAGLA
jgi:curved DNA-binding protein CbpA